MNLIINLIILICVGFLLGSEREKSHKVIGVRSTILVLLGAFIFTFISTKVGGDPARIIAQVVCGSGFIGAGIIFKNDASSIFNLTTAIFVWVLSGLGCMFALGLYPESILISIIIFIILKIKKMKSAKFYYTPAFQLRSFDIICDANGTPLEEIPAAVGVYKKEFPRIAVCSIYDREKQKLYFGHCTCSTKDLFSRKFARKVSYIRAENKPDFVVDVPEGAKVSDITREYTHKIINGEYV